MPNPTTIDVLSTETLSIRQEHDVIPLTKYIRQQAVLMGMNTLQQTKLITAASELARNMLNYAGGGYAQLEQVRQGARMGFRMTFEDEGPGIADIGQALQDGYSSGTGLGLGLPGTRRLMSEFSLSSVVGKGTAVTVICWKHA